jgi:nucleoside 2-deoxyribosyltransferase
MSKLEVFISGPIQGMELEQSYRERIGGILLDHGYEPIDPWQREEVAYSTTGKEWWKNVPATDFIRRDLEDIDRCHMLVAYLPKLSAGTCMELFYAKTRGKITVVICQLSNPSPWIIAHSDIFLRTIAEFRDFLKNKRPQ